MRLATNDIADMRHRSTAHWIVKTLIHMGYIEKDRRQDCILWIIGTKPDLEQSPEQIAANFHKRLEPPRFADQPSRNDLSP